MQSGSAREGHGFGTGAGSFVVDLNVAGQYYI